MGSEMERQGGMRWFMKWPAIAVLGIAGVTTVAAEVSEANVEIPVVPIGAPIDVFELADLESAWHLAGGTAAIAGAAALAGTRRRRED